jgi:predicted short-subunit dehydrogenase-like oxidoreductase (DUF2520 family)
VSERQDWKRLQEDAQDLKAIKLPNNRLPVEEKERIVRHCTPKYADTHMEFLVENAFKAFVFLHEDGSEFVVITDYVTDYMIHSFEKQIGGLLEQCTFSGWVKCSMPKDSEEYEVEMFKILLEQKFIISRTDANGDLILKSLAVQQKQEAFLKNLLEGTLQLDDAPK